MFIPRGYMLETAAMSVVEKTKLLCAWDRSVQVEAFTKKGELFPNLDESDSYFPQTEDEDAGDLGVPFTQPENEEQEWMGWVDWANPIVEA